MKKIIFVLAMAAFSSSLGAQEQWSLFSKVTATWCPNCGTWGWTMFEDGLEAMEDRNVLSWTLHYSGDLRNQTAEDITDNLKANSQPRFYVNNDDLLVSSGSVADRVKELEESVDLLNSFAPFVSVSNSAVYNGYNIEVSSEYEFLEGAPGNYFIVSYLIKDHVIANQSNQGSMADHRFVLMDSFGDESFGSSIASPQAEAGQTAAFLDTYEIEIAEADVADYYVATVVWNFLETTQSYRFFNATMSQVTFLQSATVDTQLLENYAIGVENQVVSITPTHTTDFSASFLNLEGKLVKSQTCNGKTQIDLSELSNQMLILNIVEGDKQSSQKIFLK